MLKASAYENPATSPDDAPEADIYLTARQVWERYNITDMTLHRWLRDERKGFPQPVYFGRFRQWPLSQLQRWERLQATKREAA